MAPVAGHTRVHELAARRLARKDNTPALKPGRQWRVQRDLPEQWMERHSLHGTGWPDSIK
jgi:hypothetical protein